MSIHLLKVRLSIIIVKEKFNFLNTFKEFQLQLKKDFKEEYSLDEIETALFQLEESYITKEAEKEGQVVLQEIEEDNFNN